VDLVRAWQAAMRAGDFQRAWRISDRVLARQRAMGPCRRLPRHEQWVWDGTPLAGRKVLVRCYHGLGDTIMFARFLPRLARMASRVVVWAQGPLIPALRRIAPGCQFLPLHEGTPGVDYDVDLELSELPYALRIGPEDVRRGAPYLRVAPEPRPSPLLNVGLATEAGSWNAGRSIPAELLAPLSETPGVRCFSLAPGARLDWAVSYGAEEVLLAARRVKSLDLVITVDTFVAHIAGAVGAPTWTLLPARADWRWGRRSQTPWYPGMRLLRQRLAGHWAPVAARVIREVTALAEVCSAGAA
jgi:hypothetical protein